MGSGQLLTPLETQNLRTGATIPTPIAQDLGKEENRKRTKTPEDPAAEQGMLGKGKEPGEILEVALSPAKVPGPLPGGSANCPVSPPTAPPPQPSREPGTPSLTTSHKKQGEKTPSFVARKKTT